MPMKGGLGRFQSRLQSRNALNFRILPQMRPKSRLPRRSKFCACPRHMGMWVSLCPVPVAELCLRVSLYLLPMPYIHASIAVACPCRRTMFEGILVLSPSTLYDHPGMPEVTPCGRHTVRKATSVTRNGSQAIPVTWYRGQL